MCVSLGINIKLRQKNNFEVRKSCWNWRHLRKCSPQSHEREFSSLQTARWGQSLPVLGTLKHSVQFEDGLSRQSWLWLAITDLWGNVSLIGGCEYIRGRIVIVIIIFSPPFEKGRSIKGPVLQQNWSCPSRRWLLTFLKKRCGEEGQPKWPELCGCFLNFSPAPLFFLHQDLCAKSQMV